MRDKMDLSVVIVNWNGLKVLRNCLRSVFANSEGLEFEVLVVDNASTDGSVAAVRSEFPQARIIESGKNLGFAAGNNLGFKAARGRHILLLNNDTIVLPGAFLKCVRFLDRMPDIGVVGCRVEFPDRSFQTSCYRFNDPGKLLWGRVLPLGSVFNERLSWGRYWATEFKSPVDVDVVAGCFFMIRAEVISQVGGLDEDFFMYGEDEEWCSRIKGAGWRIVYFPDATIIHIHRFSSSKARRALSKIECLSPVLVLHKRRGSAVAWCANLILLLGVLARFPLWIAIDLKHLACGTAQAGLVSSRFAALKAHFEGLFRRAWLDGIPSAAPQRIPQAQAMAKS